MTNRARGRRPSASLLISMLALFVALGGTGVAQDVVAEISAKIKGKQIAKNAITSKKIKDGTIQAKDIKSGVIPTPQNVDAYTKSESDGKFQAKGNYQAAGNYLAADGKAVDADKLDGKDSTEFLGATAKAADSDKLDGLDSGDYMQGDAFNGHRTMNEGAADVTLFTIADRVRVQGQCAAGDPPTPRIEMEFLTDWGGMFFNRHTTGGEGIARFGAAAVENGDTQTFASGAGAAQEVSGQLFRDGLISGSEVIDINAFSIDPTASTCEFSAFATQRDTRTNFIFIPFKK